MNYIIIQKLKIIKDTEFIKKSDILNSFLKKKQPVKMNTGLLK